MREFRAFWLLALALAAQPATGAEDVVVVATQGNQQPARSAGEILDYTGKGLVLRLAGGREQTIPAGQVLEIQSRWIAPHVAADEKFQQHRYEEALELYREALASERRPWAKRLILSQCVWCLRRTGQGLPAARVFLQITQQDPATPYFEAIPLPWETSPVAPAMETQGINWIAAGQPSSARLLGAAWLLATPHRAKAVETLRQLSADAQPEIAFLADAQLWRTALPTAGSAEAQRWQAQVDRMPTDLQAGPLLLLARLLSRMEQHEQSALTFLKVAILHSRHAELAARSLLGAGGELERIGQRDEASRLYEELIGQYPESDAVSTAQQRLRDLANPAMQPEPAKQKQE